MTKQVIVNKITIEQVQKYFKKKYPQGSIYYGDAKGTYTVRFDNNEYGKIYTYYENSNMAILDRLNIKHPFVYKHDVENEKMMEDIRKGRTKESIADFFGITDPERIKKIKVY